MALRCSLAAENLHWSLAAGVSSRDAGVSSWHPDIHADCQPGNLRSHAGSRNVDRTSLRRIPVLQKSLRLDLRLSRIL